MLRGDGVEPDQLDETRLKGRMGRRGNEALPPYLDIAIDEDACSIRVYDPRAFHDGRRTFCRRLLEAASRQPGIEKGEIDLASASCRLEFSPGWASTQSMAGAFADSVREAAATAPDADRTAWWRPTAGWSTLTAYRLTGDVSLWETHKVKPGRIRLRNRNLPRDRARLTRLADTLAGLEGVKGCRVSPWFRTITLEFLPESPVAKLLVDKVERALAGLKAAELMRLERFLAAPSADADGRVALSTGLKRLKYLALAGGSFALTLVALVVPGIPTVPCLLATSYYLARSSPRLNDRLRRTAFFGPILSEWEQRHGLSWSSQGKLIGLTVTIVAVTVVLTPLTPIALIVILVVSSLGIYGVARLPVLPNDAPAEVQTEGPAHLDLALPAP
jgi:uncharacterized membrane protein YbaN (DUF454 family)